MNKAIDPVIADTNRFQQEYEQSERDYRHLPDAEWQDIIDCIKPADINDVFWEGAGIDGFISDDWQDESEKFSEKALRLMALQDDHSLGKMFRNQIENYFIEQAQSKLAIRGQVKSHIDDLKQALEA